MDSERGRDSGCGTQVRDSASEIYCYPLNLDAAETETIAGPSNGRSNKDRLSFLRDFASESANTTRESIVQVKEHRIDT